MGEMMKYWIIVFAVLLSCGVVFAEEFSNQSAYIENNVTSQKICDNCKIFRVFIANSTFNGNLSIFDANGVIRNIPVAISTNAVMGTLDVFRFGTGNVNATSTNCAGCRFSIDFTDNTQ
ncbi:MAG: hypothetical protein ACXABY_04035 [Candidatus Thorarchaeota archaeon]